MNTSIFLLLAVVAGSFIPIQSGANGMLSRGLGSPLYATLAVFLLATLGTGLLIILQRSPIPEVNRLQSIPWWSWSAGGFAVLNILLFTILPGKIGVANMIALFVAGQILSSMLFDHFGWLNFPIHPISVGRVAGVALLIVGVVLIKKF